jgi:hypothetical protein
VPSFYSRIKGKLPSDFGGRYVSMVLQETMLEAPDLVRTLFPKAGYRANDCEIVREFPFRWNGASRRADLAVVSRHDRRPIALLEVKYEDEQLPSCHGQLGDYTEFAASSGRDGIPFVYLTQRQPPADQLELLERARGDVRHLTYAELYHRLQAAAEKSPAVRMLRDFLQEDGMVFTTEIDQRALELLLIKGLGLPHNHGLGRRKNSRPTMANVPGTFEAVLSNVSVLGDTFYSKYREGLFSQLPTVNFAFDPLFESANVRKQFEGLKTPEYAADVHKLGGCFAAWSFQKITVSNPNRYLYVQIGLRFDVDRNKAEDAVTSSVFARVDVYKRSKLFEKSLGYKLGMTEEACWTRVERCVTGAVEKAIRAFDEHDGVDHLDTALQKEFRRKLATLLERLRPQSRKKMAA